MVISHGEFVRRYELGLDLKGFKVLEYSVFGNGLQKRLVDAEILAQMCDYVRDH